MLTTLLLLPMTAAPALQQPAPGRADIGREIWFDIDADGYEDLLVLTPGAPNRLLRNAGDGTFMDATSEVGLGGTQSTDAQLQDLDRDGHRDLLLVGPSFARLFRGLAGGQFEEATASSGLAACSGVQSAAWVDFDRDGLMDLRLRTTAGFQLLRNEGDLGFQSVELGLPPVAAPAAAAPATIVVTSPTAGDRFSAGSGSTGSGGRMDGPGIDHRSGSPGSNGPGSTVPAGPGSDVSSAGGAMGIGPFCAESIKDQATGDCGVMASSDPMLGMLYPLSTDLFVDVSGNVGFGTTNPASPISLDNGLFQVGITQAQVGGGATMELTTEDSDGDQATRLLLRGGNGGDTADIEFYRGARGAEQLTLTLDGSDGSMAAEGDVLIAGKLGIGTTDPNHMLDVSGDARISGMVKLGSNDGTDWGAGQQWSGAPWPGYKGLAVRRCITSDEAAGGRVAVTQNVRLERDGTNGGMRIGWDAVDPASSTRVTVTASWVDLNGNSGSLREAMTTGDLSVAGTRQLFTDADEVSSVTIKITETWQGKSHSEVSLSRWNQDRVWTGHMITAWDQ